MRRNCCFFRHVVGVLWLSKVSPQETATRCLGERISTYCQNNASKLIRKHPPPIIFCNVRKGTFFLPPTHTHTQSATRSRKEPESSKTSWRKRNVTFIKKRNRAALDVPSQNLPVPLWEHELKRQVLHISKWLWTKAFT